MRHSTLAAIKAGAMVALTLGFALVPAAQSRAQAPFDAHFVLNMKSGFWGTFSIGATVLNDFYGAFSFDIVNPVGGLPGLTDPFDTYCIDLYHNIGYDTIQGVYLKSTNDYFPPAGAKAAWLYNNFSGVVSGDNEKSAGLQLAIWEAITDNTIDLDNGDFKVIDVDANAKAFANAYLAAWNGQTSEATWLDTRTLENDKLQSLIGPSRIPEPTTMGLLGVGAVAFAGYLRRRKR